MVNLIYLRVAKVGSQNADMTTSIERTDVTLESGKNFNNFVKHLHIQNYLKSEDEKPRVIKAVEWKDGKIGKEVDKAQYQKQVIEALEAVNTAGQAIDYKALSEKQSSKLSEMESRFAIFEQRIKDMEGNKEPKVDTGKDNKTRGILEKKATELEIKFDKRLGDAKLIEKIQAIESDFNIN